MGGFISGAVLGQLALLFLVPFLLTRWPHSTAQEKKPLLVSESDKSDSEIELLKEAVEGARAKVASLRRQLDGDIMGDSVSITEDPEARAKKALWERDSFVNFCTLAVSQLSTLCDEALVDALEGSGSEKGSTSQRLAGALQGLFAATLHTTEQLENSPSRTTSLPVLLFQEKELVELSRSSVARWLNKHPDRGALESFSDRLQQCSLCFMKATLWASATNSNFQWALPPGASSPCPFDDNSQQLFSLDGRALSPGAPVLPLSPSLLPRTPVGGGRALTEEELSELARKRCRMLVVSSS